jgi:hypothetical protein
MSRVCVHASNTSAMRGWPARLRLAIVNMRDDWDWSAEADTCRCAIGGDTHGVGVSARVAVAESTQRTPAAKRTTRLRAPLWTTSTLLLRNSRACGLPVCVNAVSVHIDDFESIVAAFEYVTRPCQYPLQLLLH